MLISIVNYFESDRRTAFAAADMALGSICKVTANANGDRLMTTAPVQADLQKVGAYAIDVTSVPVEYLGNRVVSIKSGDAIVEVRRGAIVEYDPSLLDASLDPARSGVLPTDGATLAVSATGLPCTTAAVGAITSPVILRCYNVVGGKVRIELL
jgi:hypothetical protein